MPLPDYFIWPVPRQPTFLKIEIAHKIMGNQFAQTDKEQVGVENLWCGVRMMSSDELAAATQGLVQESPFLGKLSHWAYSSYHQRKYIKHSAT